MKQATFVEMTPEAHFSLYSVSGSICEVYPHCFFSDYCRHSSQLSRRDNKSSWLKSNRAGENLNSVNKKPDNLLYL